MNTQMKHQSFDKPIAAEADLWEVFKAASKYDASVAIEKKQFQRMLDKYVPPVSYLQDVHHSRLVAGEPCLFTDFKGSLRAPFCDLSGPELAAGIVDWFKGYDSAKKHRIFAGPTGVNRYITPKQIAEKWIAGRTRFGITDLYIRGSRIDEEIVDSSVLSDTNILLRSSEMARGEEQFSFVFSSAGQVSDSHSDAFDSTNACFVGQKLWLGWDTYEGVPYGLQDVERIPISKTAHFCMESFLELPSARWLVVNPGETLFMPVNMTHKVITLAPYLGTGGFFVDIPSCIRMMAFWCERAPLWLKRTYCGRFDTLTAEISDTIVDVIDRLSEKTPAERKKLGADYLGDALQKLRDGSYVRSVEDVLSDPCLRNVVEKAERFVLGNPPG